ncbi:hypothetical protein FHL15_008047 [Xylaria flabelliformis]|uniref:3-carboxymuconate cyclase n=1 Tax=Xylaria flabelliformis TaxID=2512241 RepID=A0A553HSZ3_9PEZI|nr:hypothetical protein FHL15_008047 [Xylaria flabelliformis]
MHCKPIIPFVLAPLVLQTLARPHCKGPANGKAIYMISNEEKNAVLALPIGENGLFAAGSGTLTATGGTGMTGLHADKKPAVPDALFSQSSVAIVGNNLFAVNPGSNSVSMFAINPFDPTKLTLIGKPVAVPGEFPVTVAASERTKVVCVGTSGAVSGLSCSTYSPLGIGAMDTLRPFDLGQTTPPVGPTNTVSHAFFSEDESTIFTTVKGNPATNKTGFLAAFPVTAQPGLVGKASVAQQGMRSSPEGTAVLFGTSLIPGSDNLFVADASFGAVVLTNNGVSNAKAAFTVVGKGVIEGQSATCWSVISPATKTAFVTDVNINRLVEMSIQDASIKNVIDLSKNGDSGLTDLRAAGNLVYALAPGNGTAPAAITVVDAVTKKQVQHFQVTGMDFGKNAQGMAMLL